MLVLACLLAAAAAAVAAPATTYDQRQDGDFNVRADVQNVVFVVAVPEKLALPSSLYGLFKNGKRNQESEIENRSDIHVMQAFVEPSEPYHVEIGESSRQADGGGAVEVVIAGRRRLETEPEAEGQSSEAQSTEEQYAGDRDEYKLIGATEQCGPDRERDPVTLMCRARSAPSSVQSKDDQPAAPASPAAPAVPAAQQVTIQHASPEVVPASA